MEIKIEKADKADTDALVQISKQLFSEFGKLDEFDELDESAFDQGSSQQIEMEKMILSDKFLILKAVAIDSANKEKIIGYLGAEIKKRPHIWKIKETGHINEVFVLEECRKKGIAIKMIEKAIEWIKSKNQKYITVGTHSAHELSNNFWLKREFGEYNKVLRKEV